jgi:hypothetical protein
MISTSGFFDKVAKNFIPYGNSFSISKVPAVDIHLTLRPSPERLIAGHDKPAAIPS